MSNLKKQASIQNQFNRHVNFCKDIPPTSTTHELNQRLETVNDLYQDFKVVQTSIEETTGDDVVTNQYALRGQIEDYYFLCVSKLKSAIENIQKAQQAPPVNNQGNYQNGQRSDIKLPRIKPPQFSGDYKEWPSFKDLYLSLIHNNASLDNVQKFHYLRDNVSGEPSNLISSLHLTDANYPEAWKRINDRYEHKRFIVDCHLKSFFNQKQIHSEDPSAIKKLIDNSTEIIRSLQVIGLPVNQWDAMLVHVIASKLDKESHKHWELTLKKDEIPTFTSLAEFLENRWQSLEMIENSKYQSKTEEQQSTKIQHHINKGTHQNKNSSASSLNQHRTSTFTSANSNQKFQQKCIYCNNSDHITGFCPEFISLSYENKNIFVQSKKLCFNCLKPGHSLKVCSNKGKCQQCGKRHHTSLHKADQNHTSSPDHQLENSYPAIRSKAVTNSPTNQKKVLLATAILKVKNSSGLFIQVRALIDQGSENSLITEKLAKKLGLLQRPECIPIIGVGEVVAQKQTSCVTIMIKSNTDPSFNLEVETYTMQVVTGDLPSLPIERQKWTHLQGLKLADKQYEQSSSVDLLLGAEVYEEIILDGLIKKVNNSPTAMNSRLGWLLFGRVTAAYSQPARITCFNVSTRNDELNITLKAFWELEEVIAKRKFNVKEQQAEDIFIKSISRNSSGRYQVALPFDPSKSSETLGESRISALYCLYRMEKRFKSNDTLKERYHNYIQNLINSQHIELVPKNRINAPVHETFYLPHHGVAKESSLTTKLRVVFNASRKSTSGVSLNDKLLTGPTIQDDLFSIIIRWRKHKVAFIADIEKMFRQVKIIPNHRDYQRILWRFSPNDPVCEYRITTVIDGTASATFLATRTLMQAAEDGSKQFPAAAEVIKNDFYIDDVSSGSDTIQSATQLQHDLITLLNQRGFILKKWFSNKTELMDNVPLENRHDPEALVELIDKSIKTLGVYWNQKQDWFEFKVTTNKSLEKITKRAVLSDISKLFDPIGWLSPSTVVAKNFLQSLWNIKDLNWDKKLPKDKSLEWQTFREQLSALEEIKIIRWIGTTTAVNVQIHGFADASNLAYASVVYTRVTLSDGTIKVNLISGKTKVAPIKTISTPKLELCGCLLLSNLVTKIKNAFKFQSVETHLYSDSTISLAWITSHPNHWNTFVANRITEIQQLTNINTWHYVDTNNNPADCASRGVMPKNLKNHPLWWYGPSWLIKNQKEWPKHQGKWETQLEQRKIIRSMHVKPLSMNTPLQQKFKKYSSLFKLQRITAIMLRWLPKSNRKSKNSIPNATELREALRALIKHSQKTSFPNEIESCLADDELPIKSKLISLRPFLDEDGILRVGGRLSRSDLNFKSKHPIILPKRDHLTKLIIEQAHSLTLHGGPSLMSAILHKYWIFGKSEQIKRVISNCVTCFQYNCKPQQQIMADLPRNRVIKHRAFLHTGVDFAGPIFTKTLIGRCRGKYANTVTKCYISIFVCFTTKAIHIEFVSDMTSDAFIAAYKRFASRRGPVSDLYSDCGTNFVGADRIMQEHLQMLKSDPLVSHYFSKAGTSWHFNPPATSHFGGLWESGVKSIKYHLRRLVGKKLFNFEEMTTILCQIEACLNSRPLCPMNDNLNDNSYLTPGHFILGEAPTTIPEPNLLETNINRLSRWNLVQRIYQEFWKYWSTDYLSKLQQRPKWIRANQNVKVGQLVLYRDDNAPPAKWPMARILEVHPGDDNNTRVVTLKTAKTILKRPITKISVLPISDNYQEQN